MPHEPRVMVLVDCDVLDLLIAAYEPMTAEMRARLTELTENIAFARSAR